MKNNGGYSLVELLVALAIVTFTVAAIVAVVRKGSQITISDAHRKRARALIDSCFESSAYNYEHYGNMAALSSTVVIDSRTSSSTDDLSGSLTVTVAVDSNKTASPSIEFKRLTALVSWSEPEGSQSITIEKMVTDPQFAP